MNSFIYPLRHYSPEILFNHHKQIIFEQNILYAFSILLLCKNELWIIMVFGKMVFSIIQFCNTSHSEKMWQSFGFEVSIIFANVYLFL